MGLATRKGCLERLHHLRGLGQIHLKEQQEIGQVFHAIVDLLPARHRIRAQDFDL